MLDLHGRHTFVVLRRSLGHVQIELKDVVKLVPWVEIAKTFGDTRVLGSWTLHADRRLRSLRFFLVSLDLGRMIDDPVVVLFVPDCDLLVLFVLLGRNEMINNVLLKFQLVSQLVNGVEHVIPLAIEVLLTAIESVLHLTVVGPEALEPPRLVLQFLLYTTELLLRKHNFLFSSF